MLELSHCQTLRRHAHMVFDWERTSPLLSAIKKTVHVNDIVVDIGCGLGILSFAACKAGAKRVYAIDVDSEALEFAKWQAKQFGMDKKICFLEDHSTHIDLAEKGDVLIQETVGPLAFDENFLPTLIDAKKRFLKRGGKIIPETVSLYGAPVGKNKKLLVKPTLLKKIATRTTKQPLVQIHKTWKPSRGAGYPSTSLRTGFMGVLLWPHIVWAKSCITDCSPLKPTTHWGQTFFPHPQKNQKVGTTFWLTIAPNPKDPLHYSEVRWKIA